MAYIDFKRYTWLIELLNNFDGVTFEDIDDAWQDAEDLNPEGKPLPLKTFYNHIRAIKSIFDIDVDYSRKDKKYRVRTQNAASSGHMQKSLMSMLSLSATMDKYKGLSGRILYEEEPHVFPEWIRKIMYAMDHNKRIRLEYKKYGDDNSTFRILSPYCLKMFRRRWYLLAKEGKELKTFALDDRTLGVEEMNSSFELPKDFDAEAYFKDAFGIRTSSPKIVVIKAFGREADYLRSTPLHPSQKEEESVDGYTIFSLFLGIDAWEFYQELLSHGDRIEILEPKSLRKDISDKIEQMRAIYA